MKNTKIICLVGPSGAGKSTIANLLNELIKVTYFSLSTKVREYVAQIGLESPTRSELQMFANKLREEKGNGIFAQLLIEELILQNIDGLILIDGVRHPDEIDILKHIDIPTYVLGITSSREKRFERILARNRVSDPKSWEEFLICDKRENGEEGNEHQQENLKCILMSDFTILNEGNIDDLNTQLNQFINEINNVEYRNELSIN